MQILVDHSHRLISFISCFSFAKGRLLHNTENVLLNVAETMDLDSSDHIYSVYGHNEILDGMEEVNYSEMQESEGNYHDSNSFATSDHLHPPAEIANISLIPNPTGTLSFPCH